MPGGKSYGRVHHDPNKILEGVAMFTNLAYLVRAEHKFVSFLDVQNAFQKIYKRQLTNEEKKSYFGRDNINEILNMYCSREFELKGDCTGRTIPEVRLRRPYTELREEHKQEFLQRGLDPEVWMPHEEEKKKGHSRKPEPAFGSAYVPERRDSHRSTDSRDFQRTSSQSSFNSFRENAPSYRHTNINERFKPPSDVFADPVRGPSPRFSPRTSPANDFAPGVPQPIRAAAAKYSSQQSHSNHEQGSSNGQIGVGRHQNVFNRPASGEEFEGKNNPRNLRGEKSVTWDGDGRQSTSGRPTTPKTQQQGSRAFEDGWEPKNSNMGFGRQNSESGGEQDRNIARNDQRNQRDVFDDSDSNWDEPPSRSNNQSTRDFGNGRNSRDGQYGRQHFGVHGNNRAPKEPSDVFDDTNSNWDEPPSRFNNQGTRDFGNGRNSRNGESGRQNCAGFGAHGTNGARNDPGDVFDDTDSNTDEPPSRFNNQGTRDFGNGRSSRNGDYYRRQDSGSNDEQSRNIARKDQRNKRDVFDESDSDMDEPQGRFNNQSSRDLGNRRNRRNMEYNRQNFGRSGNNRAPKEPHDVFDDTSSNSTLEDPRQVEPQHSRGAGNSRAQMNSQGISGNIPTSTPTRAQCLSDFITASVHMHQGVELSTVLGFVEKLDPHYEENFGESETILDFIEKHCRQVIMTTYQGKMLLDLRQ
ncbi:hypothetical protein DdX_09646 [Ditylenchus destructor]|uniref:DUF7516 domain-containing protein n=1 Tax=Ditylenchus destructor TaxID=166010 RepID=A0AAD4R631_9BILA|nr:hypothetical protein DdX_09646 [Ditylenchus destructor]